jgi:uncharacterized protein (DUF433 family)
MTALEEITKDEPLVKEIRPLAPEHLEGDLIQPGHPLFGVVWINRARVSGTPCFYASRVPITTIFHCLETGETLEEFLDGFEGVTREQAVAVLRLAREGLLELLPQLPPR